MPDSITPGRRFESHAVDGDLLTLREPNGTTFDVFLQSVRRAEGEPPDVRIVFEMGWPTYERTVEVFGFFHATEDVRGDGPPGGLIEGKRVRVEARLDDALARAEAATASAAEIAAWLLDLGQGDPQHALLDTEAWFALHVDQASEDGLREGYSTAWADAERVSR